MICLNLGVAGEGIQGLELGVESSQDQVRQLKDLCSHPHHPNNRNSSVKRGYSCELYYLLEYWTQAGYIYATRYL